MNVTFATVAALLALLPGVGFVVGVNFADKNVREIVFRNTPAEIGYVIFVSLVVHLLFMSTPTGFNIAEAASEYVANVQNKTTAVPDDVYRLVRWTLFYVLVTTVISFVPGILLGRAVRNQRIVFFAKHPWMLDLVDVRTGNAAVFAQVFLTPSFSETTDSQTRNYCISISGYLDDGFFDASGTLIYLVFASFEERRFPLALLPDQSGQLSPDDGAITEATLQSAPGGGAGEIHRTLGELFQEAKRVGLEALKRFIDIRAITRSIVRWLLMSFLGFARSPLVAHPEQNQPLLVEGRSILRWQYRRRSLGRIQSATDRAKLEAAVLNDSGDDET